jgi:hypothetical protein
MKKWKVDGKTIEAAWYSEGTDFVQFWIADNEVVAFPTGTPFEEVIDGPETELLAEVRTEGQADVPAPTGSGDADAKPRTPPRKVSQHPGKVSRVRAVEVHAGDSGHMDEQPDKETAASV